MSETVEHPAGGYRYAPDIRPYSLGVAALSGFEVVSATFRVPVPFRQGFARALEFIQGQGRPLQALCGMALRCPQPYSLDGFREFNDGYYGLLDEYGLLAGRVNPLARTNVSPVLDPPAEPCLYGFSFTAPVESASAAETFVISGGGEVARGQGLERRSIVRVGESSPEAMREKAVCVMDHMSHRLAVLGADWSRVTTVNVYTGHDIYGYLQECILGPAGPASAHGIRWHYARPPIDDIEFEMDLRGVRRELIL